MLNQKVVAHASSTNKHRSEGLATVVNDLLSNRGAVLDLGPLSSGTTEAFLKKGCKCYVEDIGDFFTQLDDDESNFQALLEDHLIPKSADLKFDAVLCWDLLNFLELSSIRTLFSVLRPHLKSGTVLHLMHYTGIAGRTQPKHFKLLQDFNYEMYAGDGDSELTSKRHTTVHLLKHLDQFDLKHSHVNQEGMHKNVKEMVLEFESKRDGTQAKRSGDSHNVSYFSKDALKVDSPAFKSLNLDLAVLSDMTVLDLGRRSGRDTRFINKACHRLYIEDVYSSIIWKEKLGQTKNQELSLYILRLAEPSKIDFVFAWDIFNFCSTEQIQQFGELIDKKMASGGYLHFYVYHEHSVPALPVNYDVHDTQTIAATGKFTGQKSREFSSTAQLMKLLPQFNVERFHYGSTVNGESYQEFLLKKK